MGHLKKILVTGANGFLGSHLLKLLVKNGYKPVAYLRSGSDISRLKSLRDNYITFVAGSNSDEEIEELFKRNAIEAIFHTATNYGRGASLSSVIESNVVFPLKLIEHGIKHQLKLFVNTDTFFGKQQFELKYLNNYTTSKRILQGFLANFSANVNIVNLRIEHVYGENDSDEKFVTDILKQLIINTNEILLTEGFQKRDFVYVEDVANAYISVLQNWQLLSGYQEFEVGTGQSIPVREFVQTMAALTSSSSLLKFGAIANRQGEILDSFADTAPLNKLGWQAKYNHNAAISKIYITEKKRYTDEN